MKWIYGLISLLTYFGAPLYYIYYYHLMDSKSESYSFVALSLFGFVVLVMIFVLTKVLLKAKGMHYLKLMVITLEICAVLYVGVMFFNYISLNATDISKFLYFTIGSTLLGTLPTALFIYKTKKPH